MLRLNRMTDYAILLLASLASRQGEVVTAGAIAAHTQLNQPTVAKLAKALVKAGVVRAERGVNGGYCLARPAMAINAAEVIEAIEGPIALTACVEGVEEPCETRHGCFMSGHWNEVNSSIKDALEKVTLDRLFNPEAMFPDTVQAELKPNLEAAEAVSQKMS